MSDYPDPDEEYELMYADELDLLRENEEHDGTNVVRNKSLPAKRSLDFSSPVPKKPPDSRRIPETTEDLQNRIETTEEVIENGVANTADGNDIVLTPNLQPMDDLLTPANVASKRTVEDLFGDLGDIDFEEQQPSTKRQRTEEEIDLELIERIKESRRSRLQPSRQVQAAAVYDAKENMSLNIPRWAFLPLTNSDGDRVYVRLESEEAWDAALARQAPQPALAASHAGMWDEAQRILEAKQQRMIEMIESSSNPADEPLPPAVDLDSIDSNCKLWVDRYRPQSYLDLLSEEPVNRALLHWLHLWDKVVFKKEVKTSEPQQRSKFSARAGQFQLTNKWRGKKEAAPELDADGRPHHKVALLCGPPGVGKTTLAHLLARLAGYRPVELNASDERSTDAFRTALQSATLMRPLIDSERRPNCLILDEIDGAPLPTVELLVKWCTATVTEGKKKGKSQSQPLKRPVIAICNDLYASSLRPLRAVSLVIQVPGVSIPRLAARLGLVAAREGVRAPPHVLQALAARAQGDVRAAIQVLSFIRMRAKQLSLEDVNNAAIGSKDCSQSVVQALQAVFTATDPDPDRDRDRVLKVIHAAGDYDRLVDGILENYLTARVDSRLQIACETLAWLRLYDTINTWTMRAQNYSLYAMLPLCIASCQRVLGSRTPQRVRFPTQAIEMSRKKAELDSILWSVWRGCVPRVSTTRKVLALDMVPLLPYLLSPSLRSANVQLCSESERSALRACAGAMCDYGLQYSQQRTPDGFYAFLIEPDVYRLALFGTEDRGRPPPAVRQAIAKEQQLETIRRADLMSSRVPESEGKPRSDLTKVTKDSSKVEVKEAPLPNHLQRLQPKEVKKTTPQVHKDFFGRIVPLSQVHRNDAPPDVISSSSVFYHYQEGFNNAVRRNIRTKDLL